MEQILEEHWHHIESVEVLDLLESDPEKGLDTFEYEKRREYFGPNTLTRKESKSALMLFLLQFHQPLIYILLAATAITLFLEKWADASVIFAVVFINAVIGYIQESKALAAIEALARMGSIEATVIRAGKQQIIDAAELVPGDIVLLHSGDRVPADMRLVRSKTLQINESALTGESVPVDKNESLLPHDTILADRANMVYSTSLVTYGSGTGIVVSTGDNTEIGRINELISEADILETPLTKKINHFSKVLLCIILALAGLTFAVGALRGEPLVDMFMASVALAVGAIPEGLPAAITITLAIGVSRLASRRSIVRKLPAVETLGSTTVICSDKTGTLTQNEMTVQFIYAGQQRYEVSGVGYDPEGEVSYEGEAVSIENQAALRECLQAGLLCNESRLVHSDGQWLIEGDPTEGSLIVSAAKTGLAQEELRERLKHRDTIPFESQHQYMATLHDAAEGSVIYVKGSAESILARCEYEIDASGNKSIIGVDEIMLHVNDMAQRGLRVLALARKRCDACSSINRDNVTGGLEFLGLQGMMDPARPEVISAVSTCHNAGIQVKMITGDHDITAMAIAQHINIERRDERKVSMNGRKIASLSDEELVNAINDVVVFSRVAPEQKFRLVKALQAKEHVVAMTGDGVNDAPALQQANIGVAMGMTGTEVAKEAADMILVDDNFATIETAVEEGRGVFDNLIKFITWTLPTNVGEGLVILMAVFAGVALPILPVQILWINMTTAVLLGLMLAFEPKEPEIMLRRPRDPGMPILTRGLMFRIMLVGVMLLIGAFGAFNWVLDNGGTMEQARTVASNIFVFGELFYLFNCRSLSHSMFYVGVFSNRWLLLGVVGMSMLQLAFTYVPFMNTLFKSAPIGMDEWSVILGVSLTIYLVVEIEKYFTRKV
jgi:Ca2+-transporting ATPase